MKIRIKSIAILFSFALMACGGKEEKKKEGFSMERKKAATEQSAETTADKGTLPSEKVDLTNKGLGPVKSITLDPEIDQALAAKGKEVYDQMCIACHRTDKKFIGPAPKGILERRTPEWIMNMILNPQVMVKEDPLAKALMQEFNGSPMADQNLTEDQARAVLEYFRTL